MHRDGDERRLLGCGAGEDEAMTTLGRDQMSAVRGEAKLAQQDDLVRRMNDARDFPANTCGASRHAAMIAEALCSGEDYPMLAEEPDYCGSIAATVAALWECRTKLAQQDDLVQAAVAAAPVLQVHRSVPGHMLVSDTDRICDAIFALIPKGEDDA
jgi:hypothetical protein